MRELNINLRPSENLYVTTYEDGEVEYIPCTPDENEKEEKRLRNLGVKFTTEMRNDLIKYIDYKNRLIQMRIILIKKLTLDNSCFNLLQWLHKMKKDKRGQNE